MKTIAFTKKLITGLMILFTGVLFAPGMTHGMIIYVDDDNTTGPWDGTMWYPYQYIQDGIDNANGGDTVHVYNGMYFENVEVNKMISLIGENKDSTVVDGNESGHVVDVSVDSVIVSGFGIKNSGSWWDDAGIYVNSDHNTIKGNDVTDNYLGIYLSDDSDNNFIFGNTVENNDFSGILIMVSFANNITGNTIALHQEGITVMAAYNDIYDNNITSNNYGIFLDAASNLDICRNNIADNGCGINVFQSRDNNIYENNITGNNRGIWVGYLDSYDNLIYHNNFTNNTQKPYDELSNTWDNGYPSGGNYWDDFDEPGEGAYDNNCDGVVDSAYDITGDSNQDRYPLMNPWDGTEPTAPCGDANGNCFIELGDVVYLINFLYRGGPVPIPVVCVGDVSCDSLVDLGDIVWLISYLYKAGPAPCPECCD